MWEYKVITLDRMSLEDCQNYLQTLGQNRWELVSVIKERELIIAYLKREV